MRAGRVVQAEEASHRRAGDDVLVTGDVVEERLQSKQPIVEEVALEVVAEPALGRQRQPEVRKQPLQLSDINKAQTFTSCACIK